MFRLVSKNKRVRDRNAIAFCSSFVASRARRVSAAMERGELRARNEFRAKNGGREKKAKGEGRQKKEEKEQRASVSGGAIYRSAARVKEAWKSVSRERTRGERLAGSRKSTACFTFGRATTPSAPPFRGVCPRVKGGREHFEESGQPTNDFLAKLKMHSARDANSFSRARVSLEYNSPLTLPFSLSFCARTNNFQRVPLLFLPSCSSRRNISLRDKLRYSLFPLLFPFLFSLQRFALIVLEACSTPASPAKGTISSRRKGKRILPRVSIAPTTRTTDAPSLKERFGRRGRFPFFVWSLFLRGDDKYPEYYNISGGAGRESSVGCSRVDSGLSPPPAPLELDVLHLSPHFSLARCETLVSFSRGTTAWRQLTMCILITTLSPGLVSRPSAENAARKGGRIARWPELLAAGGKWRDGGCRWGKDLMEDIESGPPARRLIGISKMLSWIVMPVYARS